MDSSSESSEDEYTQPQQQQQQQGMAKEEPIDEPDESNFQWKSFNVVFTIDFSPSELLLMPPQRAAATLSRRMKDVVGGAFFGPDSPFRRDSIVGRVAIEANTSSNFYDALGVNVTIDRPDLPDNGFAARAEKISDYISPDGVYQAIVPQGSTLGTRVSIRDASVAKNTMLNNLGLSDWTVRKVYNERKLFANHVGLTEEHPVIRLLAARCKEDAESAANSDKRENARAAFQRKFEAIAPMGNDGMRRVDLGTFQAVCSTIYESEAIVMRLGTLVDGLGISLVRIGSPRNGLSPWDDKNDVALTMAAQRSLASIPRSLPHIQGKRAELHGFVYRLIAVISFQIYQQKP